MLEKYQIEDFQKSGAVLLKGVFADFVETAREAIEENMQNPSWRERTYRPDDGGQAFFQDYVVWDQFDGYRALVRDSAMPELAAKLMQSKTARVFHDHILVKEPGNSVVTPWHQDQPYYLCEGRQSVSFWVPLDPIRGNARLNISRVRTNGVKISNHSALMEPTCLKETQVRRCLTWITCGTNWISWVGKWNQGMRLRSTFARCTARLPTPRQTAGA